MPSTRPSGPRRLCEPERAVAETAADIEDAFRVSCPSENRRKPHHVRPGGIETAGVAMPVTMCSGSGDDVRERVITKRAPHDARSRKDYLG